MYLNLFRNLYWGSLASRVHFSQQSDENGQQYQQTGGCCGSSKKGSKIGWCKRSSQQCWQCIWECSEAERLVFTCMLLLQWFALIMWLKMDLINYLNTDIESSFTTVRLLPLQWRMNSFTSIEQALRESNKHMLQSFVLHLKQKSYYKVNNLINKMHTWIYISSQFMNHNKTLTIYCSSASSSCGGGSSCLGSSGCCSSEFPCCCFCSGGISSGNYNSSGSEIASVNSNCSGHKLMIFTLIEQLLCKRNVTHMSCVIFLYLELWVVLPM